MWGLVFFGVLVATVGLGVDGWPFGSALRELGVTLIGTGVFVYIGYRIDRYFRRQQGELDVRRDKAKKAIVRLIREEAATALSTAILTGTRTRQMSISTRLNLPAGLAQAGEVGRQLADRDWKVARLDAPEQIGRETGHALSVFAWATLAEWRETDVELHRQLSRLVMGLRETAHSLETHMHPLALAGFGAHYRAVARFRTSAHELADLRRRIRPGDIVEAPRGFFFFFARDPVVDFFESLDRTISALISIAVIPSNDLKQTSPEIDVGDFTFERSYKYLSSAPPRHRTGPAGVARRLRRTLGSPIESST